MCPHWVLQNVSKSWLPFKLVVFLVGEYTLTCIPGPVHLHMSRRTCMSKMWSCVAPDSGNVDVCQVMIAHTIIGKIQASSLTTLVCYESRSNWNCTEILVFLTMKLELLPPLLSHPSFLTSKHFFSFLSKTHGFHLVFLSEKPKIEICPSLFSGIKCSITAIVVIEQNILFPEKRPKPKSRPA